MVKGSERLRFPCYRCYRCGRLLTKLDILAKWAEAEKDISKSKPAICRCGSRHVTGANPTLQEELTTPRIWKLWWYEVFLPWLGRRLGR